MGARGGMQGSQVCAKFKFRTLRKKIHPGLRPACAKKNPSRPASGRPVRKKIHPAWAVRKNNPSRPATGRPVRKKSIQASLRKKHPRKIHPGLRPDAKKSIQAWLRKIHPEMCEIKIHPELAGWLAGLPAGLQTWLRGSHRCPGRMTLKWAGMFILYWFYKHFPRFPPKTPAGLRPAGCGCFPGWSPPVFLLQPPGFFVEPPGFFVQPKRFWAFPGLGPAVFSTNCF